MKKVSSLIMALVLCLSLSIPAFATESNTIEDKAANKAILRNSSGVTYLVDIETSNQIRSVNQRNNGSTGVLTVTASTKNMRKISSGHEKSKEATDWDSRECVEGVLKIEWDRKYKDDNYNQPCYLLTKVTGNWTCHQPGMHLSDKIVSCICGIPTDENREYITPHGDPFEIEPDFTNYARDISGSALGACSRVDIWHGDDSSNSWEFALHCEKFNNASDWLDLFFPSSK